MQILGNIGDSAILRGRRRHMKYEVLAIGISQELHQSLKSELKEADAALIQAMDIRDGIRLLSNQPFSLVIIDLQELEQNKQIDLLIGLRRMRYAPILALIDYQDVDMFACALDGGADVCQPLDLAPRLVSKQAKALLRRYTAYNHRDQPEAPETIPFQCGDIFIDPLRHIVKVQDRTVELRPREFNLLLYFMRNPHIILSTEQICEHAWGMEGSYNRGVSQPVRILRKAIEPDPDHPIYIKTVWRVGYCFTAYKSESCDMC